MPRELSAETEIAAPPEHVWAVLADFAAYPEWNPFIQRIAGELREGARLEVRIAPPGGRAMTFKPTVVAVEPGREVRWLGRLLVRGLFDGEHRFELRPAGEGRTRFVQSERFSGILVGLLGRALGRTEAGFHAMNDALKRRVESSTRPS
jgi:hypothetical protein